MILSFKTSPAAQLFGITMYNLGGHIPLLMRVSIPFRTSLTKYIIQYVSICLNVEESYFKSLTKIKKSAPVITFTKAPLVFQNV